MIDTKLAVSVILILLFVIVVSVPFLLQTPPGEGNVSIECTSKQFADTVVGEYNNTTVSIEKRWKLSPNVTSYEDLPPDYIPETLPENVSSSLEHATVDLIENGILNVTRSENISRERNETLRNIINATDKGTGHSRVLTDQITADWFDKRRVLHRGRVWLCDIETRGA